MRKSVVLLIVAVFCVYPLWAKAPEKKSLHQYADSLQQVCMETSRMNERLKQEKDSIIAQIRAEYETDINRYHTHINWNIAIIGLLFTGVLAGAGFLANKDVALKLTNTRKRIIALNKDLKNYKNNLTQVREDLASQINKNTGLVNQINEIKNHVDIAENTINSLKAQIDKSAKAALEAEEKASAGALFIQGLNEEDIDKKIELYTKAIELNPNYKMAYYNRGLAYRKKGDNDQAISNYNKAIELDNKYAKAYNNRGFAYMCRGKNGDYERAMKDFETGLSLNPNIKTRKRLEKNMAKLEAKMKGQKTD